MVIKYKFIINDIKAMIHKKGLRGCLEYFDAIKWGIGAICVLVFYLITINMISFSAGYRVAVSLNVIYPLFLFCGYLYIMILYVRDKLYLHITGRDYQLDHNKYNRSFIELVDYFHDYYATRINPDDMPDDYNWRTTEGVILGSLSKKVYHVTSEKDGFNYLILGRPQSGKTASIIIPTALRFGMQQPPRKNRTDPIPASTGSVFAIDIKGDIYSICRVFRNIRRFNLMDPYDSCFFNPLEGIENLNEDNLKKFIKELALVIVPKPVSGETMYFYTTAVDYFVAIALYLLDKDITTSFPDIIKAILDKDNNGFTWVLRVRNDGPRSAQDLIANKKGENEKNISGGYSKLCNACQNFSGEALYYLLDNKHDPNDYISMKTLENGYDVYVCVSLGMLKSSYGPLVSLITQHFLTASQDRAINPNAGRLPDGTLRPIAFILDEFAQLKFLSSSAVTTAFEILRAQNCTIICALQSMSSLNALFDRDIAKEIIDCVRTFVFLSVQEVETRKWASDLVGSHNVLHISNSVNGKTDSGKTVSESREPIIFPEEFGSLIDKNAGRDQLVIYSNGKYAYLEKLYWFNQDT